MLTKTKGNEYYVEAYPIVDKDSISDISFLHAVNNYKVETMSDGTDKS